MTNGSNGYVSTIDAKARTWTSPTNGVVLKLRQVSAGLLAKIQSDRRGKPAIPTIRVNYGSTTAPEWGTESNPDDPVYKEALANWQSDISNRVAIFVISAGVDIEVPDGYAAEIAEWDERVFTPPELKYFYVTQLIPASELALLTDAILSQTVPTEEGIAQATAGFPSNS